MDLPSAVDHLASALGFAQVAEAADDDTNSVLLRQGKVQLVVTAGPGTWGFLDAHGDGIADIAFTCDDVAASREAAVVAGASVTGSGAAGPRVSGFGSTCHTLLPLAGDAGARLPPGRNWVDMPRPSAGLGGRIRLLDHVAVCVEGGMLAHYADFYERGFGLSRYSSEYVDAGDQALGSVVVRNSAGRVTFTFVAPDPMKGSGQLDDFLEENMGPGVQHLAFGVDDIVLAVCEARERGVEFLQVPDSYHDMLSERFPGLRAEIAQLRAAQVLVDRDEWGYLLQLFTRSPYQRNTLFYEFIQRRGARGFGSANIRALYEAIARDRLDAG